MLNDPHLQLLQFAGVYFLLCCNVFNESTSAWLLYSPISIYFCLCLFPCVSKRSMKRRCSEFEGAFSDYEANSHWCTSGRPSIGRQASVTLRLAIMGGQFFSKVRANNKHIISMLSLFSPNLLKMKDMSSNDFECVGLSCFKPTCHGTIFSSPTFLMRKHRKI